MPVYFQLGITHILDIQGFDHMLFLMVLLAGIDLERWNAILASITAFTVGHSITLALTVLRAPILASDMVEFLIPVTIFLTAAGNLLFKKSSLTWAFFAAAGFGLIHGMGFAGYLTALLPTEGNIWRPLLFFNLGVETGQIVFAAVLVGLLYATRYVSKPAVRIAQTALSLVGLGLSLLLAINNWSFS